MNTALPHAPDDRLDALAVLPTRERARLVDAYLDKVLSRNSWTGNIVSIRWRTAWAISYGIALDATSDESDPRQITNRKGNISRRELQTYLRKMPAESSLHLLMDRIKIADLVRSVASESRNDWQPEECRPIDTKAATDAFSSVVQLYDREIKDVRKSDISWCDAVDDAWSRAYLSYWSIDATSRYLGLTSLPIFVTVIALNEIKRRAKQLRATASLAAVASEQTAAKHPDPASTMEIREEAEKAKKEASAVAGLLKYLTPRQRLIAQMVWLNGESQVTVAQRLGCTEANISIHLADARRRLKGLGFWPEHG